jgi:hypothetical protein
MNKKRFSVVFRCVLAVALAAAVLAADACKSNDKSRIEIGSPLGIGGILVHFIAGRAAAGGLSYDVIEIEDCCSTTSQIALASGDLDAAVLCPDAAGVLVSRNSNFVIAGPVIQNSDVLLVHDKSSVQHVGIAQEHLYEQHIIHQVLQSDCQISQVSPAGLAMSYSAGQLDGIVVDIPQAMSLEGTILPAGAGGKENITTYVLVVRKDLAEYSQVVKDFSSAARELSDIPTLQKTIAAYNVYPTSETEAQKWVDFNVKFPGSVK